MENFDFLKAGINEGRFQSVAKTAKVSDEIRPELIVNISINKMCINGLASEMMGIETGNYMKAMVLTADQCGGDVNKKFYIMVSRTKSDDMMTLAAVGKAQGSGKKLFCSYAACYSQFLQHDVNAQAITADKLADLNFAYGIEKIGKDGKTYTKYTANREVHYLLEDTGVEYPNADGTTLKMYVCKDAKIVDRPYDETVEKEEEETEGVGVQETMADSQSEDVTKTESAENEYYTSTETSDEDGI